VEETKAIVSPLPFI